MAHQQPIPGDRRAQNTATPRARRALPNDDLTSDANQRRRLDEAIMPENERLAANMTRREAYAEANAVRQAAQAEARAANAAFCHVLFLRLQALPPFIPRMHTLLCHLSAFVMVRNCCDYLTLFRSPWPFRPPAHSRACTAHPIFASSFRCIKYREIRCCDFAVSSID